MMRIPGVAWVYHVNESGETVDLERLRGPKILRYLVRREFTDEVVRYPKSVVIYYGSGREAHVDFRDVD